MRVTVLLDERGFGRSVTYAVVASSAYEAAHLIKQYLNMLHPLGQIDVEVLPDERAEGPPRVFGLGKGGVKARE